VYALTPASGTIHEIDPAAGSVRRKIRVAPAAVSMRLAGDSLWVLSREGRALVEVDAGRLESAARVKLPAAPGDFDLAAGFAAISLPGEGSLAIAALSAPHAVRVVATGPGARPVRFFAQGRRILCGNRDNRTITVADTAQARVAAQLPVAVDPVNFCFKRSDDGEMFVTGGADDALVVVYPYQSEIHETRLIGRSAGAMAVSRAPEYLFVADTEAGNVTVMDVVTGKIRAHVPVGAEPRHIAVTPDDQFALALNSRSGDIAVIYISEFSNTGARTGSPLLTMIPVGARPVSAAIRRA
jgi:YVTN family beta-propeller protein